MSLDTYLGLGKKVAIGGREVVMMPLPLRKLRDVAGYIQEQVKKELTAILKRQHESPDVFVFIAELLRGMDATEIVYNLLIYSKNPDTGKPVNEIDREYIDEYLDAPTLRKLSVVFIEVNELEQLIKNLESLPWISQVGEALTMTFGISLSSFLLQSTDSHLAKQENLPSLKSTDSLNPTTDELKSDMESPKTVIQ